MFNFELLGLNGLFWQTILILAVGSVLLAISLKNTTTGLKAVAILLALLVFVPMTRFNWWISSGDPELNPDAGSNITSQLHYLSLAVIVVLMAVFLLAVRALAKRKAKTIQLTSGGSSSVS
ncbi:MAG TPA: hypothetical protein PLQ19_05275 [Aeromicrobium sp.]|nr:hypothetical protein [Aeromicrobium sp.]